MFEKMVVSNAGRRERRLSKFFVGSSILYMLLAGSALAVSIYVQDSKLTGSGATIRVPPFIPLSGGARHHDLGPKGGAPPRLNLNVVKRLDQMVPTASPARLPVLAANVQLDQVGTTSPGDASNSVGDGWLPRQGTVGSDGTGEPPRPVDTSRKPPDPKQNDQPRNHLPFKVSQGVLQGKAIERKTPDYPQIARAIHREGSVLVEVVISPEGRVELARMVSGDALLGQSAVDAAYGWRFQPTYLGDLPVKVTGIITFVFRLGQ